MTHLCQVEVCSDIDLKQLFSAVDEDRSGTLSALEFCGWLDQHGGGHLDGARGAKAAGGAAGLHAGQVGGAQAGARHTSVKDQVSKTKCQRPSVNGLLVPFHCVFSLRCLKR